MVSTAPTKTDGQHETHDFAPLDALLARAVAMWAEYRKVIPFVDTRDMGYTAGKPIEDADWTAYQRICETLVPTDRRTLLALIEDSRIYDHVIGANGLNHDGSTFGQALRQAVEDLIADVALDADYRAAGR